MSSSQLQNMNATSSFKYDVLSGDRENPLIRLLELLPGKVPEPIRCNLRVVPLGRELAYEGLSYCWGDPANLHSIHCNGVLFPVAANLMGALEALRKEDTPRLLWVDAVCIDQSNIDERNQQVAIMRDIYSCARRTVIWLGPESERSNEALAIVPDLLALKNGKFHGGGKKTAPVGVRSRFSLSPEEIEAAPGLKRLVQNTQARAAFLTLLERPWFSRVWIVQEVTVSSKATVHCGSLEVPFDDLAQAAFTFDYLDLHVDVGFRRPLDLFWEIWDTRRKHWDRWTNSMFQLLLRHRWCQATDPRDKVYALCGIASDSKVQQQRYVEVLAPGWYRSIAPPPLALVVDEPDYRLSTVEVYTHLATSFLSSPHVGLDLFSLIHPSEPRLPGLPSWAPDWSASDWFRTFRKSIKNTFFDLEQAGDFWSPMMETPKPGPGVPPKERAFLLPGGMAGTGRDIRLTKQAALNSEFVPTFQASGDSQTDVRVSSVAKTITLSGMVVDVVEETGQPGVKTSAEAGEFLDCLSEWAAIAERAQGQVVARVEAPEQSKHVDVDGNEGVQVPTPTYLLSADSLPAILAWTSTIMGGHIFLGSDAEALAGLEAYQRQLQLQQQRYYHHIRLAMAEFYASGALAGKDVPAEVIAEYESYDATELRGLLAEADAELSQLRADPLLDKAKSALGMGLSRRFVRGAKGYFALVPARGAKGDEIVVFKGARMPVLVRDRKEILGECYVQGIMQGEVWREELCEEFEIY